jgi:EpsI family protein
MEVMMKRPRFWVVCLLLAATALLLHVRDSSERKVTSEPLADFPREMSAWTGVDQPIDSETLEVLGAGDFLSRIYTQGTPRESMTPPISLFVGYFPSQRTGTTIHSPKNCLPGSGWAFESSSTVTLQDSEGRAHRIGEYVIMNGGQRQFVAYWYQAHGRTVANEYVAKMYLVWDAIRMNRTDGALVRVITPMESSDLSNARVRVEAFAAKLFPALPRFIPN